MICETKAQCSVDKTSDAGSQYRCGRVGRAANPHPHPKPYPTPFPTQTHTQKGSKTLVFPLIDSCSQSDRRTDEPTDRWTDKASYRVACPQLKISRMMAREQGWIHGTTARPTETDGRTKPLMEFLVHDKKARSVLRPCGFGREKAEARF